MDQRKKHKELSSKSRTKNAKKQSRSKQYLSKANRIILKIGTSNITGTRSVISRRKVKKIVNEIIDLRRNGRKIIIVTSGAIAAGVGDMDLKGRPKPISHLQAVAAVGQSVLMNTYAHYFKQHNQPIAQLLLTRSDFSEHRRFQNLSNTIETLLSWNVIPIINENDTVAVDEIKFGDNDNLAALLSVNVKADLLILLSDVNGIYTGDPKSLEKVEPIKIVTSITPELEKMAGKANKGSGGMITKIQAARTTLKAGIPIVIVDGAEEKVLKKIFSGEDVGTMFVPEEMIER